MKNFLWEQGERTLLLSFTNKFFCFKYYKKIHKLRLQVAADPLY